MDSRQGTLDINMAERRAGSLRCSETWTLAQKTKRRRWILQDDGPATARLIIPRLRDRWFKSSPRNQIFRMNAARAAFLLYQSSACPARMAKQQYAPRHLKRSSVAQW